MAGSPDSYRANNPYEPSREDAVSVSPTGYYVVESDGEPGLGHEVYVHYNTRGVGNRVLAGEIEE